MPTGWSLSKDAVNLSLERDTTDFQSGPASLKLRATDAAGQGNASINFPPVDTPFNLSAHVKAQGNLKEALLALQIFDQNWKQVSWINFADLKGTNSTGGQWKEFKQQITLPAEAKRCFLLLIFKVEGQINLDEVRLGQP